LYGKQQQQQPPPASLFLKEGLIFVKFFRENEGRATTATAVAAEEEVPISGNEKKALV